MARWQLRQTDEYDSNVVLRCYGWVDQQAVSFPKVRSESIRAVKQAFDQAGIVMPEPVYKVRLYDVSAAALRQGRAGAAVAADEHTVPEAPLPADGQIVTGDVSPDHTIEQKVAAEDRASGGENLLSPEAAAEL